MLPVLGRTTSPILLIGEAPGSDDIRSGVPWTGEVGQVLWAELIRAGISKEMVRATYLWRHDKSVGKEFKEKCYAHMIEQLLAELATARAVLLLGAEITKIFTGVTVSKVNACRLDRPKLFPSGVELTMAAYSPGVALSMTVGDFRLAIQRFANYTKEIRKR